MRNLKNKKMSHRKIFINLKKDEEILQFDSPEEILASKIASHDVFYFVAFSTGRNCRIAASLSRFS